MLRSRGGGGGGGAAVPELFFDADHRDEIDAATPVVVHIGEKYMIECRAPGFLLRIPRTRTTAMLLTKDDCVAAAAPMEPGFTEIRAPTAPAAPAGPSMWEWAYKSLSLAALFGSHYSPFGGGGDSKEE